MSKVPRPNRDLWKDVPDDAATFPLSPPVVGDKRTRYPAGPVIGENLGIAEEVAHIQEVEGKATVETKAKSKAKPKEASE